MALSLVLSVRAREALNLVDAFAFRSPETGPQRAPLSGLPEKPAFAQLLGQPLPLGVQALVKQLIGRQRHPPSRKNAAASGFRG
jgi:hypothetical protein